jgi:N-acylneuraminate cytidylyltransferase
MSSNVALIPARSGSKGVVGKNVRSLGGHPLIDWSIKACLKSQLIDRVIVSTDSEEYAQLSLELGAEVPFLRPANISDDRSTDYDFVLHALDWFAVHGGEPALIVHIRPTTPFRSPELVDKAIESFQRSRNASALRSVHAMSESAYKAFEIADSGSLKRLGTSSTALDVANDARQLFPVTYQANGYVDVLSSEFIRSQKLLHGDSVMPFVTPVVVEVDTEEDFSHLEFLLDRNPSIAQRLF